MFSHVFTFDIYTVHMWNFKILHGTDSKWGLWDPMGNKCCSANACDGKRHDIAKPQTSKLWEKNNTQILDTICWFHTSTCLKIYSHQNLLPTIKTQNQMFISLSNSKLRIWCVRPVIGWADSSMSSSESAWESAGGNCSRWPGYNTLEIAEMMGCLLVDVASVLKTIRFTAIYVHTIFIFWILPPGELFNLFSVQSNIGYHLPPSRLYASGSENRCRT